MMYSNNILNFQESTTISNACTKKVWKLIEGTTYLRNSLGEGYPSAEKQTVYILQPQPAGKILTGCFLLESSDSTFPIVSRILVNIQVVVCMVLIFSLIFNSLCLFSRPWRTVSRAVTTIGISVTFMLPNFFHLSCKILVFVFLLNLPSSAVIFLDLLTKMSQ